MKKKSWILAPSPIQCAYGVYVYLAPDKHNIHILFRVFSPPEDDRSTDENVQEGGGDFSVYVVGLSQAEGRGGHQFWADQLTLFQSPQIFGWFDASDKLCLPNAVLHTYIMYLIVKLVFSKEATV